MRKKDMIGTLLKHANSMVKNGDKESFKTLVKIAKEIDRLPEEDYSKNSAIDRISEENYLKNSTDANLNGPYVADVVPGEIDFSSLRRLDSDIDESQIDPNELQIIKLKQMESEERVPATLTVEINNIEVNDLSEAKNIFKNLRDKLRREISDNISINFTNVKKEEPRITE